MRKIIEISYGKDIFSSRIYNFIESFFPINEIKLLWEISWQDMRAIINIKRWNKVSPFSAGRTGALLEQRNVSLYLAQSGT